MRTLNCMYERKISGKDARIEQITQFNTKAVTSIARTARIHPHTPTHTRLHTHTHTRNTNTNTNTCTYMYTVLKTLLIVRSHPSLPQTLLYTNHTATREKFAKRRKVELEGENIQFMCTEGFLKKCIDLSRSYGAYIIRVENFYYHRL